MVVPQRPASGVAPLLRNYCAGLLHRRQRVGEQPDDAHQEQVDEP